ncbi:hypothetical protein J6590_026491 [Homalodisca vitripennis]|nr:hypothetical protein J6590_026491 [Homalodisca vitripennis]
MGAASGAAKRKFNASPAQAVCLTQPVLVPWPSCSMLFHKASYPCSLRRSAAAADFRPLPNSWSLCSTTASVVYSLL